jgi:hypothetical protein
MQDKSPGPYVVKGRLFFRLPDGSSVSCECVGEPYASKIVELWNTKSRSTTHDWDVMPDYGKMIEDYDRREAAGEDVSGEVRPRFPGGSDY